MKRYGFSLVELVMSIVVIAIALMTVPLMLSQGAKSNQYALMQESILAARTKMGNLLSFQWDEHSSEGNSTVRVIDVRAGDSQLARITAGDANRRVGHIIEDKRRRMTNNEINATLGIETAGVYDDIDDFDGNTSQIVATGAAGVVGDFDYLDNDMNLTTNIFFISDDVNYSEQNITFDFNVSTRTDVVNSSTNIKMVELNVTSVNRDTNFIFRVFSSNIGQSKLYERVK